MLLSIDPDVRHAAEHDPLQSVQTIRQAQCGECDDPRVEAQINQTALQFSTVKDVSVFVNGQALQDALSLK